MFRKLSTKKKILLISAAAVVALLAAGGIWAAATWHTITTDQMGLFEQTPAPLETEPPTEPPVSAGPSGTASSSPTPVPTPTPTLSPYDELVGRADGSIMKDTLNVLLIGVDYSEERVNNKKEYVGKYFNSDVMLVLAVNFKQNKVDMISLPRDSYAKIANLDGIYKMNFALQAGGGMKDAGFMNVCKTAQIMLGNIPVNYYVAVTMPVVKELADLVGGVDFNVDVAFSIGGRHYKKGMQHLDGQGVLDYCRVRKGDISAQAGDLNRVNRQKKLLVAVFKKLKATSSILDVPKILTGMQGKVFTNMNFPQLAALAVFGRDLPEKNITMRTITGSYNYGIFRKNYVLIDQEKRVKLIKDVYGVTVKPQYKYSAANARLLWAWMQGDAWLKEIKRIQAKDAKLPAGQQKLTNADNNARLAAAMASAGSKLSKYKKKAQGSAYVSYGEAAALEAEVKALHDTAYQVFYSAGWKADWSVPVYRPGQPVMKE